MIFNSKTKMIQKIMGNNYYNKSMCELCGGICCQRHAGSYAPSDFKHVLTSDFVVSLLVSGKVAIDWWDGDARKNKQQLSNTYYLRPRHMHEDAVKGSWGGVCVNWKQETGCSLSKEDRPYGCRKLIPKLIGLESRCYYKAKDKAGKREIAVKWIPYQKILVDAKMKYYQMQDNGELVIDE